MRFKTNLVISAVFAALLAFVYFYEIKGGEEREEAAKKARQLLDFSDHEATRIFIERADTAISLARTPDGWRLQSPVTSDADEKAIERYLRNLRETEIERVVEDSAAAAGNAGSGREVRPRQPETAGPARAFGGGSRYRRSGGGQSDRTLRVRHAQR